MSEEKNHHSLFHHKKEEDKPVDAYVSESTDNVGGGNYGGGYNENATGEPKEDYEKEIKHHKNHEHVGELGAVATGGYALHEKHKAKNDPEHGRKHKTEEEIAAAGAVGAGGYVFHEHHKKKEAKEEEKEADGKKHHFF